MTSLAIFLALALGGCSVVLAIISINELAQRSYTTGVTVASLALTLALSAGMIVNVMLLPVAQ